MGEESKKYEHKVGETPRLPIKGTYKNFELTLQKSIVFGKGDYVVTVQDTNPNGPYFEVYLNKNGDIATLPMRWDKTDGGEKWGTTTPEEIKEYIQLNFSDVIREIGR